MPLRIGKESWCKAYKEYLDQLDAKTPKCIDTPQFATGEHAALVHLGDFVKNIDSPDPVKRRDSIGNIRRHFIEPQETIPFLVKALNDIDSDVRGEAAYVLYQFAGGSGRTPKKDVVSMLIGAIPTIVNALQDGDVWVRRHAARFMCCFPNEVLKYVDPLSQSLNDSDSRVREEIIRALRNLGPAAAVTLPALHKLLEKEDPNGQMKRDILKRSSIYYELNQAINRINGASLEEQPTDN